MPDMGTACWTHVGGGGSFALVPFVGKFLLKSRLASHSRLRPSIGHQGQEGPSLRWTCVLGQLCPAAAVGRTDAWTPFGLASLPVSREGHRCWPQRRVGAVCRDGAGSDECIHAALHLLRAEGCKWALGAS